MRDIYVERTVILLAIRDGSTKDSWLTAKGIAHETGLPLAIVSRRLKALSKEGKIYHSVHKKRGETGYYVKYFRWQLMPKVRENLEKGVSSTPPI